MQPVITFILPRVYIHPVDNRVILRIDECLLQRTAAPYIWGNSCRSSAAVTTAGQGRRWWLGGDPMNIRSCTRRCVDQDRGQASLAGSGPASHRGAPARYNFLAKWIRRMGLGE